MTHSQSRYHLIGAATPAPVPSLDSRQRAAVAASCQPGATLVVGGPGTGKTTALIESVVARVGDGGDLAQVLVLALTRAAAQRLRAALVTRVGRSQLGVKVMTVHGFARSLLLRHRDADEPAWRLLTAPQQEFQLRELLSGYGPAQWPASVGAAVGTRVFAAEVRTALARARQLGLDPADLTTLGMHAGRPDWSALGAFYDHYLDVLDAEHALDYAEVVHRARLLLLQDGVSAPLRAELSVVHIDDFAEADTGQVALLADLARLGIDVIAWADPLQRVNDFRGADHRAVLDFADRFGSRAATTRRVELLTNHRNSAPVRAAVERVAAHLPDQGGAPLGQGSVQAVRINGAGSDAGPGSVEALVFDSAGAQYEQVADLLRRAHVEGVGWAQMAVLTRAGRGGVGRVGRALAALGVPVEVAGDEIALAEEAPVRALLLGLQTALALTRGESVGADTATRLLTSPLGGLDSVQLRAVGRALRAASGDEPRLSGELIADQLARPDGFAALEGQSAASAARLAALLARVGTQLTGQESVQTMLWTLWDGTDWPRRLRATALGAGDSSARAHRDLDAVIALFDLAARDTDLVGEKGLALLVSEVSGQQIPGDTSRESDVVGRGVQVLTAHRAKGWQWRLVVVVDVQEGLWPSLRRRGTILDADRLTVDGLAESEPISQLVAAERRLFLLAISRARERVVVTASAGTEGEASGPSRFLDELGVPVIRVHGYPARPLTLSGLVGELRRHAADPQFSPALRQGAAWDLARLAEARGRQDTPLVPTADPGHWWAMDGFTGAEGPAIDGGDIRLSPSAVESLLRCPRNWFLSRKAGGESGARMSASLGSVIHALVQHAQQHDVPAEELTGELDRVWDQIPFDARWLSASERVQADAALARFGAWRDARASRTLLGVEVPFSQRVEMGAEMVVLSGKVDRLERDADGALRIVDFKTGRSTPSWQQVASHDQLGIYQLAASLGAFDELSGGTREVSGAELVFLRVGEPGTVWPKSFGQPSLQQVPHLEFEDAAGEPASGGHPNWVTHHLAQAVQVIRAERFFAVRGDTCRWCPFELGCPAQDPGVAVVA